MDEHQPGQGTGNQRDRERAETRAALLPEEQAAGSEDPQAQAEEILEESDERTADPEGTGETYQQTSTPAERPSVD